MTPEDSDEPEHPFRYIALGFLLTVATLLGVIIVAIQLVGQRYAEQMALGVLGLACLLVNPKVWWIWELPGIKPWRELAGDIPVLVIYWMIGLGLIAYSVYGLVSTP